ncbi:MAG: Ig-like domain repeat protein, partial [Pyrinomonadaceae bacterium]
SSGGSTAAGNLTGLLAFPSASSTIFSLAVRGNLSATNGQFVDGVANLTPTFTASSVGAGSTSATADSQIVAGAITINKASTTAAITNNPATTVVGQGYTVNFSLAVNAPGSATPTAPTGNVQVSDGSQTCSGAISVGGTGSCLLTSTTAGNKSLTATYQGDANFNASPASSPAVAHTVNKADTTVGLTSATNPSVFGQSVTFTATMAVTAPGAGAPTGTIQFLDGGNPIIGCSNVALAGGLAQCSTAGFAIGNHTITATYAGDPNFNASNGSMTGNPQVVNKANTAVGLTSGANPSVFGQQVTFTATISVTAPGAGTPTGTFSFLDGGNPIAGCTGVAIAAGQAQCQTAALAAGNHTITAAYSGDGNFNTSNGSMTGNPQVVNKANTTTGLISSLNPSVFGQPVTFTATVAVTAPGVGTPSGTINFLDGGNPIAGCQNVALQVLQAQCQPGSLSVGNHTITAAYSGDGSFNTSNGSMTGNPQVVNKANTSIDLTSSQNPAPLGTNLTFTAAISVTAPGAGTPSGTVQFFDGGNPIVGCVAVAVAAGQAQCMTTALTTGNHTITAAYSGNASFNTSNGSLTGNPQVITMTTNLAPLDFDGDGKTDYAVVRDSGLPIPPPGTGNQININGDAQMDEPVTVVGPPRDGQLGSMHRGRYFRLPGEKFDPLEPRLEPSDAIAANQMRWLINTSGPTADLNILFGTLNDFPVPADYDGDGKCDIAVWTGGVGAQFKVLTSSSGFVTTVTYTLGNGASDPSVVGDYDGDGKADPAIMNANTGQFTYLGGATHATSVTVTPVGAFGGGFPIPGDYDGDGKYDFVLETRDGINPTQAHFYRWTNTGSLTPAATDNFVFGNYRDVIIPGDYDGDGKTDIGLASFIVNPMAWRIRTSPAGTLIGPFNLGNPASDYTITGDYNGDQKGELTIWLPAGTFQSLLAPTYLTPTTNFSWGQSGDYPVAYFNSH